MGALDEAMIDVREGLRLSPDIASAYVTLGAIHGDTAEYELATAAYRRALDLDPNLGVAKYNLAFTLLAAGEYEEGFALYEWRLEQETAKADQREFLSPKWDGQRDLAGRVLLVHAEQGLGDVIQFSRYAQMLAAKGVKVVLEAPPPLAPLPTASPSAPALPELSAVTKARTKAARRHPMAASCSSRGTQQKRRWPRSMRPLDPQRSWCSSNACLRPVLEGSGVPWK
jgi:tetratricopeptide (TPR) repeat protein